MSVNFESVLERLLRCPTAPFHEGYVLREIRAICAVHALRIREDAWGNLRVEPRNPPPGAPLLFVAHTDHPGFAVTSSKGRRAAAAWWGGVRRPYFKNAAVRLYPYDARLSVRDVEHRAVKGRVSAVKLDANQRRVEQITVALERPLDPSFKWVGGWDLPAYSKRGRRIRSAHIDDIAGVALALTMMIRLKNTKLKAPVAALFTRAEEDGFHGALAAAGGPLVPKRSLCLSIETSARRSGAVLGKGVVVRLGDAAGVFDPHAVRWVFETAAMLQTRKEIPHQKRVMDGGTCEATAFWTLERTACGIALPLEGYHNMGGDGRIALEQVDLSDARAALALLNALARSWKGELPPATRLAERLRGIQRRSARLLGRRRIPKGFRT